MSSTDFAARVLSARSEVGNASRTADRNPARLDRARKALHALNVEKAIRENAPLADEDAKRLAHLLLTGGTQ